MDVGSCSFDRCWMENPAGGLCYLASVHKHSVTVHRESVTWLLLLQILKTRPAILLLSDRFHPTPLHEMLSQSMPVSTFPIFLSTLTYSVDRSANFLHATGPRRIMICFLPTTEFWVSLPPISMTKLGVPHTVRSTTPLLYISGPDPPPKKIGRYNSVKRIHLNVMRRIGGPAHQAWCTYAFEP